MKIIPADEVDLKQIAVALKQGKTIVYPTETCYGLGCDARNPKAVQHVFDIKQRQKEKSVLVVLSDVSQVNDLVPWNATLQSVAERYWPGPLTVVAKKFEDVDFPQGVVAPDGTVAFRVTAHPIAAGLCEAIGGPIVSTSANIQAGATPYDVKDVIAMFEHNQHQPDIIIDAGVLTERAPSTIVAVRENGQGVDVLRQGEMTIEDL